MPPLTGLRVLDLTRVLAGPYCAMMLGDMGAEVIKIEEPTEGDDTRTWAPHRDGWSTFFLGLNRSKKSLAIDLKSDAGADVLRRLIDTSDVLIENFPAGQPVEARLRLRRGRSPEPAPSSTARSPATDRPARSGTCPATTPSSRPRAA